MSKPMYGQCPKCGGNLAQCWNDGCPRDPPKKVKLTRKQRAAFNKIVRDAAKTSEDQP